MSSKQKVKKVVIYKKNFIKGAAGFKLDDIEGKCRIIYIQPGSEMERVGVVVGSALIKVGVNPTPTCALANKVLQGFKQLPADACSMEVIPPTQQEKRTVEEHMKKQLRQQQQQLHADHSSTFLGGNVLDSHQGSLHGSNASPGSLSGSGVQPSSPASPAAATRCTVLRENFTNGNVGVAFCIKQGKLAVDRLSDDGAAQRAGLCLSDEVFSIDGRRVWSVQDAIDALRMFKSSERPQVVFEVFPARGAAATAGAPSSPTASAPASATAGSSPATAEQEARPEPHPMVTVDQPTAASDPSPPTAAGAPTTTTGEDAARRASGASASASAAPPSPISAGSATATATPTPQGGATTTTTTSAADTATATPGQAPTTTTTTTPTPTPQGVPTTGDPPAPATTGTGTATPETAPPAEISMALRTIQHPFDWLQGVAQGAPAPATAGGGDSPPRDPTPPAAPAPLSRTLVKVGTIMGIGIVLVPAAGPGGYLCVVPFTALTLIAWVENNSPPGDPQGDLLAVFTDRDAVFLQASGDTSPKKIAAALVQECREKHGTDVPFRRMMLHPNPAKPKPFPLAVTDVKEACQVRAGMTRATLQIPVADFLESDSLGVACRKTGGVLFVVSVASGGLGERIGITPGCILSKVDGRDVLSPDDIKQRLHEVSQSGRTTAPLDVMQREQPRDHIVYLKEGIPELRLAAPAGLDAAVVIYAPGGVDTQADSAGGDGGADGSMLSMDSLVDSIFGAAPAPHQAQQEGGGGAQGTAPECGAVVHQLHRALQAVCGERRATLLTTSKRIPAGAARRKRHHKARLASAMAYITKMVDSANEKADAKEEADKAAGEKAEQRQEGKQQQQQQQQQEKREGPEEEVRQPQEPAASIALYLVGGQDPETGGLALVDGVLAPDDIFALLRRARKSVAVTIVCDTGACCGLHHDSLTAALPEGMACAITVVGSSVPAAGRHPATVPPGSLSCAHAFALRSGHPIEALHYARSTVPLGGVRLLLAASYAFHQPQGTAGQLHVGNGWHKTEVLPLDWGRGAEGAGGGSDGALPEWLRRFYSHAGVPGGAGAEGAALRRGAERHRGDEPRLARHLLASHVGPPGTDEDSAVLADAITQALQGVPDAGALARLREAMGHVGSPHAWECVKEAYHEDRGEPLEDHLRAKLTPDQQTENVVQPLWRNGVLCSLRDPAWLATPEAHPLTPAAPPAPTTRSEGVCCGSSLALSEPPAPPAPVLRSEGVGCGSSLGGDMAEVPREELEAFERWKDRQAKATPAASASVPPASAASATPHAAPSSQPVVSARPSPASVAQALPVSPCSEPSHLSQARSEPLHTPPPVSEAAASTGRPVSEVSAGGVSCVIAERCMRGNRDYNTRPPPPPYFTPAQKAGSSSGAPRRPPPGASPLRAVGTSPSRGQVPRQQQQQQQSYYTPRAMSPGSPLPAVSSAPRKETPPEEVEGDAALARVLLAAGGAAESGIAAASPQRIVRSPQGRRAQPQGALRSPVPPATPAESPLPEAADDSVLNGAANHLSDAMPAPFTGLSTGCSPGRLQSSPLQLQLWDALQTKDPPALPPYTDRQE